MSIDAGATLAAQKVGPQNRRTSWTATEILSMDFPSPKWAVPDILAEGINLCAGAPKVGKSWLALDLAVAVATGGRALGKINVDVGDVLYLALEDTPRRLQSRLRKVMADTTAEARITFATECGPISGAGGKRINDWLEAHPGARLVVVDVFAKVRGAVTPQTSSYDADYAAISALKVLADRFAVAFLVIHHTRKSSADDFLDTVSGTQGIAGAADAVLVLQRSRGAADATLFVVGRDIEEAQYALRFAPDLGSWQLLDGPASDYDLRDTRRRILHYLRDVETATPKVIADALGLERNTIKVTCHRMAEAGQLTVTNGSYSPVTPVTAVTGHGPAPVTAVTVTPLWGDRSE